MTAADELQSRLTFALNVAERAGRFILSHYQSAGLEIDRKRDSTPVTEADRGAERLIREAIAGAYPQDGVLGEEYGEHGGTNDYRWILDPVDGTKSFVHGVPLFGTLIGLEHAGRVVLGVCRFPALSEVMYAAEGSGAWWQVGTAPRRPARVSPVSRLEDALCCLTTVTSWEKCGYSAVFEKLIRSAGLVRGWGDCYGHMLVATGRAEFIVEPQMNPWDAAALVPILREAGGSYLDWEGREDINSPRGVSVNAGVREAVLGLLEQ